MWRSNVKCKDASLNASMGTRMIFGLVLVLTMQSSGSAENLPRDLSAQQRIFSEQLQEANRSNATAQAVVSIYYWCGDRGVKPDYKTALSWATKSAEAADPIGQFSLALLLLNGWGTKADKKRATSLFQTCIPRLRNLAEGGSSEAQYLMGTITFDGSFGLPKDYKESLKWNEMAAKNGHISAMTELGMLISLLNRRNDESQEKEAVRWWMKAAENGDERAQCMLAECYERGDVVEKDYSKALKWFRRAAAQLDRKDYAKEGVQRCLEMISGVITNDGVGTNEHTTSGQSRIWSETNAATRHSATNGVTEKTPTTPK